MVPPLLGPCGAKARRRPSQRGKATDTMTAHRWCSAALLAGVLAPSFAQAGPPYVTDDPEPVEYRHWEFYVATQDAIVRRGASGTAPHIEVNYGAMENLQIHAIAPLAYARPSGGPIAYGPGDVELGAKLRFIQEGDYRPMVGTFPMFELPIGDESKGLGTGHLHVFIPLWFQKSFGDWTTYGGGGYWVNAGTTNRNYWYLGWQAQRRLSALITLGGEVFYTTADQINGRSNVSFNIGFVIDLTEHHHILCSAGRSIVGDNLFQGYLAYQVTL